MTKILSIAYLIFLTFEGFCQFPNILIGDKYNPEEPSIIINPKNTNQIVAGANLDNYYYSQDGGLTWQDGIHA
jgi:hypothetical protein